MDDENFEEAEGQAVRMWSEKPVRFLNARIYTPLRLLFWTLVNPTMMHTGIIRHIRPPQARRTNRSLPTSQLRLPRPPSSPQPLHISPRRTRCPSSYIYTTRYAHRYRELREDTKVVQGAS